MYYYMLKASKPLKEEEDKFVNGYIIENEEEPTWLEKLNIKKGEYLTRTPMVIRMDQIDKEKEDYIYKEEKNKEDAFEKASLEYDVVLNTPEGYAARTYAAKDLLSGIKTVPEGNECGWILEYYFGLYIAPQFYNTKSIEPTSEKYFNRDVYFNKWDFEGNNWSAEIKVQSLTNFQTDKTHKQRVYAVQASKFIEHLPSTDIFDVWWGEIDNYGDLLSERNCPSNWKRFHCTQEIWKDYYIKEGLGLYTKKYDKETEMMVAYRIALWADDQYGEGYGPQLYFNEDSPYLESVTIQVNDI